MFKCIRDHTPCLPQWWIHFTQRYSLRLVLMAFLVTFGILVYTVTGFNINTDLADMVSDKLPFRKFEKDYGKAFPQLSDVIVVVIDADTPELALNTRKLMENLLMKEKNLFKTIYIPEGGSFFEKNGLLYRSVDELEEFADHLAVVQPFLAILSQDLSLKGLFSVLEKVVRPSEELISDNKRLIPLFGRLSDAFKNTMEKKPYQLSWQEIMTNKKVEKQQLRQFIILQPFLDYSLLYPAKEAIDTIRRLADEFQFNKSQGVKIRITGDAVLQHEDLLSVRKGIGLAAIISLILVGIVLYIGLGSSRLVFISLLTLIMGLIWTMGFAIAFIGSLNLISITFAVLYIGLGIDYSIQFCLRYRELIQSGLSKKEAVSDTAKGVGNALLLCSITTAIGFYAFVPTAYSGASELGLIAGTGMFINFFANITILPALLNLLPPKENTVRSFIIPKRLAMLPERHEGMIALGSIILGIGAVFFLPKVFFDFNPLNLSNPVAESVLTARELFNDAKTSPWTISTLANNLTEAKEIASRLKDLKEVDMAITIADFIPEKQTEKLDIIYDTALFMPSLPKDIQFSEQDYEEKVRALKRFEKTLKDSLLSSKLNQAYISSIRRLYETIKNFNTHLEARRESLHLLNVLEKGLLINLTILLQDLENLLQPRAFGIADLPRELTDRFVTQDGRYRIQVFPNENITNMDTLQRFVSTVRTITPDATDAPVTILESGKAIVLAFKRAILFALIMITLFLLTVLRSRSEIVLILIPLLLALLLTAAASVLLTIPFNFANIIVVPLLLGIGVDYAIHLVYRFRSEGPSRGGVLQTSTARAVLFSALTTIVSFGSLSFLHHKGTASMGKLLTLCNGFMIICNLIILPAYLKLYKRVSEKL